MTPEELAMWQQYVSQGRSQFPNNGNGTGMTVLRSPDDQILYHRTFKPFHPDPNAACPKGCHGAKTSGDRFKQFDERRIVGFQMLEKGLKTIWAVEKIDQKFDWYMTSWEVSHSSIPQSNVNVGMFKPVFDLSMTVIGHVGWATESMLLIPASAARGWHRELGKVLEQDIPVFVAEQEYSSRGPNRSLAGSSHTKTIKIPPGWKEVDSSSYQYQVLTTVDGEVVAILDQKAQNNAIESTEFWLIDVVVLPKILVDLGVKAGTKLAKSIIRRATAKREARALLGGPTKELSEKAAQRLAGREMADLASKIKLTRGHNSKMGIPPEHFDAMAAAAKETDSIIMFRANKDAAVPLIKQGAPGKPKELSIPGFKSSEKTGVLTATKQEHFDLVKKHGYFTVDADGVARRTVNGKVEELPLKNPFWKVEKGQVIDPKLKKPVVGDYDLLGVAPMKSKGSNVSVVPNDPVKGDWTGPHVKEAADAVNKRLDQPRVLHGAQDQHNKIGLGDDTAYAIFPDGSVHMMDGHAAQTAFYNAIGRQTGKGSYNPHIKPDTPVPADELAARRGRK